jgi:ubiquinone/menaquinone biosynthesis C-methylase UbiE
MEDWRTYDRVADTYERVHAPRLAEPAHDLVELAEVREGQQVLDVGTGTGVVADAVRRAGGDVVGVDGSLGMLRVAAATRPALAFVAGHAIDLPFREGTFDVVVGGFVLAHFTKADTALHDVARIVRPGGRVAFSAWSDDQDAFRETWEELATSVVPRRMLASASTEASPGLERLASREGIQETLYEAGFRRIRTETRRYKWTYGIDEYVDGLGVWATGRFVRGMLGDAGWQSFVARARETFAQRFPDPIRDFRDVVFAVATKE